MSTSSHMPAPLMSPTSPSSPLTPAVEFHVASSERLPECLADLVQEQDQFGKTVTPTPAQQNLHRKARLSWDASEEDKQEMMDQIRRKSVSGSSSSTFEPLARIIPNNDNPHLAESTAATPHIDAAAISTPTSTRNAAATPSYTQQQQSAPTPVGAPVSITVTAPLIPVDSHAQTPLHSTDALSQVETLKEVEKQQWTQDGEHDKGTNASNDESKPQLERRDSLTVPEPAQTIEAKDHMVPPIAVSESDTALTAGSSASTSTSALPASTSASTSSTDFSASATRSTGAFIAERVRRFSQDSSSTSAMTAEALAGGSTTNSAAASRAGSRRGSGAFVTPIIQTYEERVTDEKHKAVPFGKGGVATATGSK